MNYILIWRWSNTAFDVLWLREYPFIYNKDTLKYIYERINGYDECNFLSNGSEERVYVERERIWYK